jgi:hypothetical protein
VGATFFFGERVGVPIFRPGRKKHWELGEFRALSGSEGSKIVQTSVLGLV